MRTTEFSPFRLIVNVDRSSDLVDAPHYGSDRGVKHD